MHWIFTECETNMIRLASFLHRTSCRAWFKSILCSLATSSIWTEADLTCGLPVAQLQLFALDICQYGRFDCTCVQQSQDPRTSTSFSGFVFFPPSLAPGGGEEERSWNRVARTYASLRIFGVAPVSQQSTTQYETKQLTLFSSIYFWPTVVVNDGIFAKVIFSLFLSYLFYKRTPFPEGNI